MRWARWIPLCLSVSICLACGDTGTSPTQDPIVLQGSISAGGSIWQGFTLFEDNSVVYFRSRELTLSPPPADPSTVTVGIGLGNPEGGACVTTYRTTVFSDQTLAFRLFPGEWCILIFDSGTVPSGSVLEYDVLVDIERFN